MTGVSVWDHKPTAMEVLEDRLKLGWKPTASGLNDGDQVLGFASCVVDPNHARKRGGSRLADG